MPEGKRSNSLLYPKTLIAKALLIQHVVSFIKDKALDVLPINLTTTKEIHSGAWSTDDNLCINLSSTEFFLNRYSNVYFET